MHSSIGESFVGVGFKGNMFQTLQSIRVMSLEKRQHNVTSHFSWAGSSCSDSSLRMIPTDFLVVSNFDAAPGILERYHGRCPSETLGLGLVASVDVPQGQAD